MCQADKMNSRFEGHCAYFRYVEKNIPVRIKTDILYGLQSIHNIYAQDYLKIVTNWDPGNINSDALFFYNIYASNGKYQIKAIVSRGEYSFGGQGGFQKFFAALMMKKQKIK